MKLYLIKKQILISLIIHAAAVFIGSQVPFGLTRGTLLKIMFYTSISGSGVTFIVFRKKNLLILSTAALDKRGWERYFTDRSLAALCPKCWMRLIYLKMANANY